ncbi:MAG: hypothetical protein O3C21_13150 [Verrucomicrobia bacterium]|nr:hypothetical protein [Verrucomicrobiota bacterium]
MNIPRARGKRLHIYLSEEIYEKAMNRYSNLDAKIEQLLRNEIAREEGTDAAFGFGSPAFSKPISQIVLEENERPSSIPAPRETGIDGAFFEMNPEVESSVPQPQDDSSRLGKRDRLPVFRRKRRGST